MPRIEVISWRTDNHWMHDHLFLPVMFLINKYNCIFPPAFSEETTHFCNNYFCFKIQMNIILMRLRINRSWIIYIDFLLRQSTSYIPHPIVIKGISSNDFVQRFEIKKIGYYEISFTMVYGKRNINVLSKLHAWNPLDNGILCILIFYIHILRKFFILLEKKWFLFPI